MPPPSRIKRPSTTSSRLRSRRRSARFSSSSPITELLAAGFGIAVPRARLGQRQRPRLRHGQRRAGRKRNASLGATGLTLSGHPARSYQEALKNALDKANNNLNFVQPTPCPFSF